MIRLWTLGSLDLRDSDGREIRPILSQPKRLALLAYLALPSSRAFHRRDELLGLFWPERDQDHARAALSRAIYYLRTSLGYGVIVNRGDDEIAVASDGLRCDAAKFKDAIAAKDNARALELYRGDFLQGFFVSDLPGFEQWLETVRTDLRSQAARAARAVAEMEDAVGNVERAIERAKQALMLAPYDEGGLRHYLALLDRTGDRAGAIVAYETFARRIALDLDLAPAPETEGLVDAIRARTRAFATDSRDARVEAGDNGSSRAAGVSVPPTEVVPEAQSPRRFSKSKFATVGGVFMMAAIVVSAMLTRPARVLERGRVAVAVFANRTGDPALDPLGALAADLITQSLVQTGLVPNVAQPQEIEHKDDASAIERLGERTRAATVVAGAFYREGAELRFSARIVDLNRGNVAWAVPPVSVPADSARAAIEQVTARATGAVAALMDPRFESWFPLATTPPTFAAFQEFARGVDLQLRLEPDPALAHYRRAVALDSTFSWARMQAAVAHMNKFEHKAADSIADAMNRDRDRLTPLERHWLDWMFATRAEDHFASYRAMRRAADIAPERFLYSFAVEADGINRPRECLAALDKLGAKAPYGGGSSNYWFFVTKSLHQLGEYARELHAAKQARIDNPDDVNALGYEIRALVALGEIDSARARLEHLFAYSQQDARNVELSALKGITMVLIRSAEELRAHGHASAAREPIERVIAWHRSRPPKEAATRERRGELAHVLYLANRWDEAEASFTALRKDFPTDAVNVGFLGAIAARRTDRARAEQSLAWLERLKDNAVRRNMQSSYWQAIITALMGDRERAVRHLVDLVGDQGRYMHPSSDFESLKGYPPFEELFRPKG